MLGPVDTINGVDKLTGPKRTGLVLKFTRFNGELWGLRGTKGNVGNFGAH